jgi:hypothetical protein
VRRGGPAWKAQGGKRGLPGRSAELIVGWGLEGVNEKGCWRAGVDLMGKPRGVKRKMKIKIKKRIRSKIKRKRRIRPINKTSCAVLPQAAFGSKPRKALR